VITLVLIAFLFLCLPANLVASQQVADEIAQISALSLSYLDRISLQKTIDTYLKNHPEIKGLQIIESLTGEAYVKLFRDDDHLVSVQELPDSVKEYEFYQSISSFNDDRVGEVFLYIDSGPGLKLTLTEEEQVFIRAHPTIRVHNEMDYPPFNFFENDKPKGFSIGFMNLLASKLGIELQYITGPSWNDFINMMKKNELDVMLNIARSPEREEFIHFTPSYATLQIALYTRNDHPKVPSNLYICYLLLVDYVFCRHHQIKHCMCFSTRNCSDRFNGIINL